MPLFETRTFERDGEWYEEIADVIYPWNDRPLCSCTVEDDGDGESGPHLSIVEPDPDCRRCIALGRDVATEDDLLLAGLLPIDEHPAFTPYMGGA